MPLQAGELVAVALNSGDPYVAAAVYEAAATAEQRGLLEQLMFGQRKNALLFARWEHTPASVLLALAQTQDAAMKVRLDKNPGTPSPALSSLFRGEKQGALIGLIAQHRHAPAAVLEGIAEFGADMQSLKAVSGNPAASERALRMLAERMPGVFDGELAANPSTPADVLEQIYRRSNAFIRAAVIAHASCSEGVIAQAVDEREVVVLRNLARDRRLDAHTLARLSCHADAAVRRGVAANPAAPATLFKALAKDEASAVRRAVAAREDLTPAAMQRLAQDPDHWVRQWLGRNPRVPKKLLAQLAADGEAEVRRAVARNPGCPQALLNTLAGDADAWVRAAVAYQVNASSGLLRRLAADTDVDVLSGVASHARTPQAILRRLAQSPQADVRRGVILNRSAQRTTLRPLLEDPYYLHRLLLVTSPVLTEKDRWGLHDDPDQTVRFAVFKWFSDRLVQGTRHQQEAVVIGVT